MIPALRLLVIPILLLALVMRYGLLRRSERLRHIARRIEIVAYAYVAAILISALLRVVGVIDFSQ